MKLNVYSLKKILYQGDVIAVNCKTNAGEITVLDHHRPLISVLPAGVVKVTDTEQKDHYFNVSSGFLEMDETNAMQLLVEEPQT
jgi:F-type H+-transporting ATPase subunit epsilon